MANLNKINILITTTTATTLFDPYTQKRRNLHTTEIKAKRVLPS